MNSTLTTHPRRLDHPPSTVAPPVRRVGLLDRLALRVGIALIAWGRRPLPTDTRERRATRVENRLAALARDTASERMLRTTIAQR